jgi:hypothetical protein
MSRPWKNFSDITQDLSGLRSGLVEPSHPKQRQGDNDHRTPDLPSEIDPKPCSA